MFQPLSITMLDQGAVERTVRLRRWVDMRDRGWFSGDMHVHRGLASMALLMEAEDLPFAVPISLWKTD